jgi:hypothetical protein
MALKYVTNYFENYINGDEDIFENFDGVRKMCSEIVNDRQEKELLNNINDILFNNRHENLTNIVNGVNRLLFNTLYSIENHKYKVTFKVRDYQKIEPLSDKHVIIF